MLRSIREKVGEDVGDRGGVGEWPSGGSESTVPDRDLDKGEENGSRIHDGEGDGAIIFCHTVWL